MPRVVMAGLVSLLIFTIVSGWFFRSTGERRRLGLRERPLLYAHEAARFAGRPGLPDRALVFDLGQAAVYLFHNGPGRKVFMDGRLEIPSRETFQTYVRLENMLNEGRPGWAEPVGRMGDPLILLDHEKEFGAEATLLGDPEWRCIYYDAVASVFLSRRRGLETSFPSVDFVNAPFPRSAVASHSARPVGACRGKGIARSGVGGSVSGQVNRATSSCPQAAGMRPLPAGDCSGSDHRNALDLAGNLLLEHGPQPDRHTTWTECSLGHCDRTFARASYFLLSPRARARPWADHDPDAALSRL